jgi:pimeloyl-ACP methyl ester carboxylesterase
MTERYVEVRGAKLAVEEAGDGPAFVWAHGLLSSRAQEDAAGVFDWSRVSDGHRLIRYDARGHGESAGGDAGSRQTWPELALDLLGLLDTLGLDRVVAGGASMGCATTIHAALKAPERFAGLVLVIPPTAWGGRRVQATVYRGLSLADRTHLLDLARLAVRPLPRPGASRGTRRALSVAAFDAMFRDRARVAGPLGGAAASDLPPADELGALTMPALILAWTHDPTHPVSTARRLHEALPSSALHIADTDDDLAGWPGLVSAFLDRVDR